MTEEEIRRFVDGAVLEGQHADMRTLSRMTGVRDAKIARWVAETQFNARAERERIDERHVNVLPASTRAALQAARLAAVFRRYGTRRRSTDAGGRGQEDCREGQRCVLGVRRARHHRGRARGAGDEIRAVASGFSPRDNRRSKGSAQHIGGLVRFEVEDLLDVAPEKQYETYQRMKLLRDRLEQVVGRAEQEWDLTPPAEEAPIGRRRPCYPPAPAA